MANIEIDRQQARAEAQLDRVDDAAAVTPAIADAVDLDDGMHVEHGDVSPYEVEEDDGHVVTEASEVVDALAEAFNARDLDAIAELCCADCETPGLANDIDDLSDALDDLWNRRPTLTMTRANNDGHAVGVLWERGESAVWVAVGVVHADLDDDGRLGVLEFSDDPGLLDEMEVEPPDGDLAEGTRWEEWEEGVE